MIDDCTTCEFSYVNYTLRIYRKKIFLCKRAEEIFEVCQEICKGVLIKLNASRV